MKPAITLLKYSIGHLQVDWDPAGFTDFIVNIKDQAGRINVNIPVTGTTTVYDSVLDPTDIYSVTVIAMEGNSPGPASLTRAAIVAPPAYTQLKYTLLGGIGNLNMVWGTVKVADGYLTVVQATDGSFKKNIPSVDPTCLLGRILDPAVDYTVETIGISQDGVVQGPPNDLLTAIVASAVFSLMQYTIVDTGVLTVQWGSVKNADQYTIKVKATDGTYDQSYTSSTPTIQIPATLDASKTYQVTVGGTAKSGVVIGPVNAPLSPLLVAPVLNMVDYALTSGNGTLTVKWAEVAGVDQYLTTVRATDGSYQKNIPGTTPQTVLSKTFGNAATYIVWVVCMDSTGVVIGPSSQAYNIIVATVNGLMLNCSTTQLIAQWSLPSVLNGKRFQTTLFKDGVSASQKTGTGNRQPFDEVLAAGIVYTSQVRAIDGIVTGPLSGLAQGPYKASLVYLYDDISRLTSITWNSKTKQSWTFDDPGNIKTISIAATT